VTHISGSSGGRKKFGGRKGGRNQVVHHSPGIKKGKKRIGRKGKHSGRRQYGQRGCEGPRTITSRFDWKGSGLHDHDALRRTIG